MIHPSAIIDRDAQIDEGVEIGPYSIVGSAVRIGKGTRLMGHVNIQGRAEIGEDCVIHPFTAIGGPPQDVTYLGEDTACIVGSRNIIREYVTINRGTKGHDTIVGNDCFLMAYSHIAHDCKVGNGVIMANCATLAGHVEVADFAILGGLCAVHQFCRIGKYAFLSGLTGVPKDIAPFVMAAGDRARLYGLNVVGLERRGFSKEEIGKLKNAYRLLFRSKLPLETSLKLIEEELDGENIAELLAFIKSSTRGICR